MASDPWRDRFDREQDFIVVKAGKPIFGRLYAPGEPFDKTSVNTRKLRSLYENHIIATRTGASTIENARRFRGRRFRDADPLDHDRNGRRGGSRSAVIAGEPMTAAELLAKADELQFFTFKAEARRILGDGTPAKKAAIIVALQERAQAEE